MVSHSHWFCTPGAWTAAATGPTGHAAAGPGAPFTPGASPAHGGAGATDAEHAKPRWLRFWSPPEIWPWPWGDPTNPIENPEKKMEDDWGYPYDLGNLFGHLRKTDLNRLVRYYICYQPAVWSLVWWNWSIHQLKNTFFDRYLRILRMIRWNIHKQMQEFTNIENLELIANSKRLWLWDVNKIKLFRWIIAARPSVKFITSPVIPFFTISIYIPICIPHCIP